MSNEFKYCEADVEGYLKIMLDANNIEFDFDTPLVWCDEIKFDKIEEIKSDLGIKPRKIKKNKDQIKIIFEGLDDN